MKIIELFHYQNSENRKYRMLSKEIAFLRLNSINFLGFFLVMLRVVEAKRVQVVSTAQSPIQVSTVFYL